MAARRTGDQLAAREAPEEDQGVRVTARTGASWAARETPERDQGLEVVVRMTGPDP